jgi:hypothetical protein
MAPPSSRVGVRGRATTRRVNGSVGRGPLHSAIGGTL